MNCQECKVGEVKDEDDVIKEGRKFISCILSSLNLKFLAIDNGVRYQAMYYVETTGEHLKEVLDQVLDCINGSMNSLPDKLRDYLKPRVKSFDDTYVIMFNNEFITIKATW